MIFLKDVTIGNYKCFYEPQTFSVEPKTTVLVGMNESGKTALLKAIAKTNYFAEDENFIFYESLEFSRKELKAYQKSKVTIQPTSPHSPKMYLHPGRPQEPGLV